MPAKQSEKKDIPYIALLAVTSPEGYENHLRGFDAAWHWGLEIAEACGTPVNIKFLRFVRKDT